MKLDWVINKSQKFDMGRTINVLKCAECEQTAGKCNFLNCNNYAKKRA